MKMNKRKAQYQPELELDIELEDAESVECALVAALDALKHILQSPVVNDAQLCRQLIKSIDKVEEALDIYREVRNEEQMRGMRQGI